MKKNKLIIVLGLIVVLALTGACTSNEMEQLEGILQNVDVVKGEITIVTKDGKTITLEIDTEDLVEIEGESSTLGTLEVGASIQVEINEDNQVVQYNEAPPTEIMEIEVAKEVEVEEDEEDKPGVESGVDQAVVDQNGSAALDVEPVDEDEPTVEPGVDQEGNATPDGDVDIDGDGKITIVDVVGGMEAERERLAEEIRVRTDAGEVDDQWVREMEAERERLAQEILRALSDDTYIVVIDGKWLIMDIEPIGDSPDPVIDPPDDDIILTITNGTVQKIEGNFWTIIDQDGVVWVIDVSDLNLGDAVVGDSISLSAIINDEGIVAQEGVVSPPEEDATPVDESPVDGGDHVDDGGDHTDDGGSIDDGGHTDDGGGDHTDDGGGDPPPDDGGGDHTDDGGGDDH